MARRLYEHHHIAVGGIEHRRMAAGRGDAALIGVALLDIVERAGPGLGRSLPAYLVEQRGLSLQQSSIYTGLSFAGVALIAVFGGWAADRVIKGGRDPIGVRKAFVVAGFLGACTILLGANTHSTPVAVFWNIASLSTLGLATANLQALCRLALIPKPAVGRVTGVQQVATSLSGGTAASLSGWLHHVSGGYLLPMYMIFAFLLVGAASTLLLMRREWSPKVVESQARDR